MSTLRDLSNHTPVTVTWLVDRGSATPRTICIEASAPVRVNKFLRDHPNAEWFKQDWGYDWEGFELSVKERKLLRLGLQRTMRRASQEASSQISRRPSVVGIEKVLMEAAYACGVTVEELMRPNLRRFAQARGYACHLLKKRLGLSLKHISEILGYKSHMAVKHWLEQPFEVVAEPCRKDPLCPTPCDESPPKRLSLAKTSLSGFSPAVSPRPKLVVPSAFPTRPFNSFRSVVSTEPRLLLSPPSSVGWSPGRRPTKNAP